MSFDHYNSVLLSFLQSKVTFKCDNKVLKTGRIKLFNIKQYFIKFYIETDKKESKILELPYPYLIEYTKAGTCTLNYKVSSFCSNTQPAFNSIKYLKTNASHKIYDSVVVISHID
jgi:hypothetical protein